MTQTKKDRSSRRAAKRRSSSLPTSLLLGGLGAVAVLGSGGRAEAKLLEVFADAYVGGTYGTEPKFNSVVTQKPDKTMGNDFYYDNYYTR